MSGVYRSQVIDVVNYVKDELDLNIRLVAFVSLRGFLATRKDIRYYSSDAIVLPMFPKLGNWKLNRFVLRYLIKKFQPSNIISRSVLATNLALIARRNSNDVKVIYDGRGAMSAEWDEYGGFGSPKMAREIFNLERRAILESDYRISVSNKLVDYWRNKFKYSKNEHQIIPCTLDTQFTRNSVKNPVLRRVLGFSDTDTLLIYSGSSAGWQSFELMKDFFSKVLHQTSVKLLFLSSPSNLTDYLIKCFPGKVKVLRVPFGEVKSYLAIGDFGILIREKSITNKVASPVKFAEYLSAGLRVIISEEIGDYTEFVQRNRCGFLISDMPSKILPTSEANRNHSMELSKQFYKQKFSEEYRKVFLF